MECFEHPGATGVGICRGCGKAVCRECAISLPRGLACSPACEVDVAELNEMNERGKRIYGIGQYKTNQLPSGVLVWLLLTGAMVSMSGYFYFATDRIDYLTTTMAVLFLLITYITYRGSKRTGINC